MYCKNDFFSIVKELSKENDIVRNMRSLYAYDQYTYEHSINVGILCSMMGNKLDIKQESIKQLLICGLLHDIGKIYLPLPILNKRGRLTKDELSHLKSHVTYSYVHLLKTTSLSKKIVDIIYQHHEKLDGSGYPNNLRETEIEPLTHILTVADIYDALISRRPYHEAYSIDRAVEILEQEKGLNVDVVKALLQVIPDLEVYLQFMQKELQERFTDDPLYVQIS